MSNLRKVNSIYEDILSKVKYDEYNKRYYIDMFDYVLYSLGKRQYAMLESVCRENNIYLETLPKVMHCKETEKLFKRLKYLKDELDNCCDEEKSNEYKTEIEELREKLFIGHQIIVWRLVAINFPNLGESNYRDDIIQLGYIYLIRIIDNFDIDKCPSFSWYISNYLSKNLFRDIERIDDEFVSNKDLIQLIEVRDRLSKDGKNVSVEELSIECGFDEKKVRKLLSLEKIIYTDSVEEVVELSLDDDYELDGLGELSLEDTLEKDIYSKVFRELLIKIVNTLSIDIEKEIVIKYFGLDGNEPLSTIEISNILGMTRQGIDYHLNQAIDNLRNSMRFKYIKEVVQGYTDFEVRDSEETIVKGKYEELELFLLKQLPEYELLELISIINEKYQKPLLSYLGLINNGLSYDERVKELGMSIGTYLNRRNKGLKALRTIIKEKYILDGKNSELNDSLDYLMYRYLNSSKTKIRVR